jgi:hypothetical protein
MAAKKPPIIPAAPTPTGQPGCPQKGQTEELAYIPKKTSHQEKKRNKPPVTGF